MFYPLVTVYVDKYIDRGDTGVGRLLTHGVREPNHL